MLGIVLILLLIWIGLVVLLWAGSVWFQGYIYSEPAPQLVWAAPVAGSVLALLATGSLNAWLQVGSVERLLGTAYGGVLLQKGAVVGLMLAIGAFNVFLTRGRPIPRGISRPQ